MTHQVKTIASSILLVAALALALTGVGTVQAAPFTDAIAVEDQDVNSDIVVIDSVTAAENGWVVLYDEPRLSHDDIVGHAWVGKGANTGVKVTVNMAAIGRPARLWAAFLADENPPNVRENWGPNGIPAGAAQSEPSAVTTFATSEAVTPTTSAEAIAGRITVKPQDITSGFALVDAVASNEAGWVVLYRSPSFGVEDIVGFAPVYRGTNNAVLVSVDTSRLAKGQSTLWARLHAEAGTQTVFEWGTRKDQPTGESIRVFDDYPLMQNNRSIQTSFAVTTSAGASSTITPTMPARGTGHISVTQQSLHTGIIVLDSVTAAQDGWVVVYRQPGFKESDIVGYAPVYQGENHGIKVTIDTTKLTEDVPMLWAMLHSDNGLLHVFEWGYKGRDLADAPVFPFVTTGFGTTGLNRPSAEAAP
jgi:hypothetical protein